MQSVIKLSKELKLKQLKRHQRGDDTRDKPSEIPCNWNTANKVATAYVTGVKKRGWECKGRQQNKRETLTKTMENGKVFVILRIRTDTWSRQHQTVEDPRQQARGEFKSKLMNSWEGKSIWLIVKLFCEGISRGS